MVESSHGVGGAAEARAKRLPRWVAAVAVLPLPAWFSVAALLAPAPAWRAEYRPGANGAGGTAVVAERKLEHYWDRRFNRAPGGVDVHSFVAEWQACLSVAQPRDVPFLLVSNGVASFSLDGQVALQNGGGKQRQTSGQVIRLERGAHLLRVSLQARGWSSIALNASFDGGPPAAVGSGEPVSGVRLSAPRSGPAPCASDG